MTIERQIIDAAARLRRQCEPHLIATVVRVQGSAYRRPGARMLLTQFRWITGAVSGACLDGDIAKQAWWRTQRGEPVVVTYDSRLDTDAGDDDIRSAFGLGCDGVVDVMLERAGAPGRLDPLEFASGCIRTQRRGAIVTVIGSSVAEIEVGSRVAVRSDGEVYAPTCADETLRTQLMPVNEDLAAYLGRGSERGVLVIAASDRWPGIRDGDVILSVDGRAVRGRNGSTDFVFHSGSRNDIEVLRGGKRIHVSVER